MLAATGGHDKAVLLAVITQLIPYIGYPRPERHQLPQRGDSRAVVAHVATSPGLSKLKIF
jgi:hypothetical protein